MIKIRLWSIGQILLSWNQWTMHFVKAIITISSNQILLSFLFSASLQNFHFFNTGAIRNTSKGVCLLFARVLYVEALLHFLCMYTPHYYGKVPCFHFTLMFIQFFQLFSFNFWDTLVTANHFLSFFGSSLHPIDCDSRYNLRRSSCIFPRRQRFRRIKSFMSAYKGRSFLKSLITLSSVQFTTTCTSNFFLKVPRKWSSFSKDFSNFNIGHFHLFGSFLVFKWHN